MSSLVFPKWLEKRWADEKAEEESKKAYSQYWVDHAACPNCGGTEVWVTTAATIGGPHPLNMHKNTKDTNKAGCETCGWRGIKHDMVPVSEPKIVYNLTEVNGKTRCVCRQLCDSEEKE